MRKLVGTAVAVALVLSGCGGGGKKDNKSGQYGSDLLTGETSTVPPSATTAAPGGTSGTAKKGLTAPTNRAPTATTLGAPRPGEDPIVHASKGGDGEFAGILLGKNSPAKKIVYELLLQEGLDLKQKTLDHVVGQIKLYSGKPVTVERTSIPGGPSTWTTEQLGVYIDRYSKFKEGGDTAVTHVLVVHGNFPGASGVAFRADALAAFPDTYRNGGVAISGDDVEDIVVMHETGHNLGLVDLYLNEGRGDYKEDPAPGGHHSPNHRSVMYYTVDQLSTTSVLEGGPPHEYDSNDVADLKAIHDGAAKGSNPRKS